MILCVIGFGIVIVGVLLNNCKKREEERQERGRRFAQTVREVEINKVDKSNDGSPVFIQGSLTIDGPPTDPKFNLITRSEAKIYRKV